MKRLACVLLVVGCGGSKPAPRDPGTTMAAPAEPAKPVASECAVMAEHVAGVLLTFPKPPKAPKETLADIIKTRCETDAWSADAKKCWGAMSNAEDAKPCAKLLTTEQHDAIMADARKLDPDHAKDHDKEGGTGTKPQLEEGKMGKRDRGVGGGGAPGAPAPTMQPPPPPPPPPARAPAKAPPPKPKAPAKGDPCGGGE